MHALIGRHTLPVERQRYFAVVIIDLERAAMGFDGLGDIFRHDLLGAVIGWLDDLQVPARQQFRRIGNEAGITR